jgi:transposase
VTSKRERAEKQAAAAAALAAGETVATAAEAAKVHETTVYRWAKAERGEFARLVQAQKARLAGHWETMSWPGAPTPARSP